MSNIKVTVMRAKAPISQKEPVKLREKVLANGNRSLYLDIYHNGKRSYEFLKLYLINAITPLEKETNKQTLQTAQSIKAKRQIEIQNHEYGFSSQFKVDLYFLDYFKKMIEERRDSHGNYGNWVSCLNHLECYCDPKTKFRDVDYSFVMGFKVYLEQTARTKAGKNDSSNLNFGKPLSQNTKSSYFNKLRACINQAFEERIIPFNPLRGIESIKTDETERVYLDIDEVKALVKTDCRYPVLKRAFLFSCLTGLRWSDINKLTWDEVQQLGTFTRIVFKQKKTKGQEYLDINSQALEFMGEPDKGEERVFQGLKYSSWYNVELSKWCMKAGITKDVTFHSGRHTFAVMMLNLGADIYTVSKLLGHKELKTTQIYAKVLDKKKQEAVQLIPDLKI